MIETITGPNTYAAKKHLDQIKNRHLKTFGDMSLRSIDGTEAEFEDLAEAVLAVPFLTRQSLVIAHNFSSQKPYHDKLIQLLDKVPEETQLILYEPAIDKRTALYKVLNSRTKFADFQSLNEDELIKWVVSEFDNRGVKLDRSLARVIIDRVGDDQWLLEGEIDKLSSVEGELTNGVIEDLVAATPNETIFALLDAVAGGRQREAMDQYRKLIQARLEPAYILSMVIWQLNNLTIAVHGSELPERELASTYKISPFVLGKARRLAGQIEKSRLAQMWRDVMKADQSLKTTSVNDELLVEQLIARLSS